MTIRISANIIFAGRQVKVQEVETGVIITDEADVVISARGTLNNISWPKINGFSDLKIPVMHSAAWDKRSVVMGEFKAENTRIHNANSILAMTSPTSELVL